MDIGRAINIDNINEDDLKIFIGAGYKFVTCDPPSTPDHGRRVRLDLAPELPDYVKSFMENIIKCSLSDLNIASRLPQGWCLQVRSKLEMIFIDTQAELAKVLYVKYVIDAIVRKQKSRANVAEDPVSHLNAINSKMENSNANTESEMSWLRELEQTYLKHSFDIYDQKFVIELVNGIINSKNAVGFVKSYCRATLAAFFSKPLSPMLLLRLGI